MFDEEKTAAPNVTAPKAPTVPAASQQGTNPTKQAIKLSAKEQLLADHLSAWDNYKPAEGTEKVYHLLVENVIIKDLDFKSSPKVVKINQPSFRSYWFNHYGLGLTIHRILHDPNPTRTEALKEEVEQLRINGKTL